MNSKPSLNQIRADLKSLQNLTVVIYGSYTSGNFTTRSDIDVAIITKKTNAPENQVIWEKYVGQAPEKYDLKVFELLPLDVKYSLMKRYLVVFGNGLELSEYFYHFRKLWNDCQHRYLANQFSSAEEKIKAWA